MDDAALARVERQRLELESNIAKLRKSLRHWQTLEIDYEGLKEEFLGLPEDSSLDDCLQAGLDFKAELVDEKELSSLLRVNNGRVREPSQLVDLLSKRVDYVSRNIETVRKQLSEAEKRRNALLLVEEPEHRDDAGLPLAEITEELDDSGNVISSKVQNPGADAPQLIDVLKKAGIDDLKETNGTITDSSPSTLDHTTTSSDLTKESRAGSNPGVIAKSDSETLSKDNEEEEALLRQEMHDYRNGLDEVGAIVAELDLEEDASDVSYDEDEDNFDIDSDFDDGDDDDDEESDDDTGKSKQRLRLSKDYRKQMEDLQSKLGLQNVGPEGDLSSFIKQKAATNRPAAAEAAREAALARQAEAVKSSLKGRPLDDSNIVKVEDGKKKTKKRVAFSSELDIAPESANAKAPSKDLKSEGSAQGLYTRPVLEAVVERSAPIDEKDSVSPTKPSSARPKQSLFKSARKSQPQNSIPELPVTAAATVEANEPKPPSAVITRDLVERSVWDTPTAPDLTDFSDASHKAEIALEYQRMRMKRIQAQEGGFIGDGEDDNYGEMITPIGEHDERTGKEKKISRFKAARLNNT
ncbi:hypothetical protein LTR84_009393 [Exophiala bonariae]|uniref:DUF3835 domain-containing protein n=1 Tax=Exophiala bonariae TaxID=1690606 RepID=A0AAV9MY67_9EURO|nr:hypothetical protein LTR84_009393 [Exophiala bonariae]